MSEAWTPQELLRILAECQQRSDELGAELAAAHLDLALHALCDQFSLSLGTLPSI
jgi:hypothetical protein